MNMRQSHRLSRVLAVLLTGVLAAVTSGGSALAASTTGTVTFVEYQVISTGNEQFVLKQGGINYIAEQTSPGCGIPNLSADAIKQFSSLAQAAYLAGKTVTIQYTSCLTFNWITAVADQ
jgi:hypothetical protein